MIIAGIFPFNNANNVIPITYAGELAEITSIINHVSSADCRGKVSREKTMPGKTLYSPKELNKAFKQEFSTLGWSGYRVRCDYPTEYYTTGFVPGAASRGAFREMDFIKNRLGVEVQFGKYAFMVYNVCAKMTIFHNLGLIDAGVEIVPVKNFADDMSTGVSYFEQFVWDLSQRGVANIDIPVYILGIAA